LQLSDQILSIDDPYLIPVHLEGLDSPMAEVLNRENPHDLGLAFQFWVGIPLSAGCVGNTNILFGLVFPEN